MALPHMAEIFLSEMFNDKQSWASCSKLTMLLVNDSLKFQT